MVDQSQWWPAERIRAGQLARLAELVEHARRNVPHYADTEPYDERDWERRPLLSKAELRANGERLAAQGLDGRHGKVGTKSTSGSSGMPLQVLQTETYFRLFYAVYRRNLRWHGVEPGHKTVHIKPLAATDSPGTVMRKGNHVSFDIFASIEDQIALLEHEAPQHLYTHPTNLRLLLRAFGERGRGLASLRVVRTQAEQLDPALRAECASVLGVPLFDNYGAVECGFIAVQCPEHEHYHVQSELNFVEGSRPGRSALQAGRDRPPGGDAAARLRHAAAAL